MGEHIEFIAIDKIAPDAVVNNHKSIVDAINQLAENQRRFAEAAGVVRISDDTPPDSEPIDPPTTP